MTRTVAPGLFETQSIDSLATLVGSFLHPFVPVCPFYACVQSVPPRQTSQARVCLRLDILTSWPALAARSRTDCMYRRVRRRHLPAPRPHRRSICPARAVVGAVHRRRSSRSPVTGSPSTAITPLQDQAAEMMKPLLRLRTRSPGNTPANRFSPAGPPGRPLSCGGWTTPDRKRRDHGPHRDTPTHTAGRRRI